MQDCKRMSTAGTARARAVKETEIGRPIPYRGRRPFKGSVPAAEPKRIILRIAKERGEELRLAALNAEGIQ